MIGWLIYQQEDAKINQTYIQWFLEEAKSQSVTIEFVYRESMSIGFADGKYQLLIDGKDKELPNFIVNRSIEPLIQQFFTDQNVPIFNDVRTASIANHKGKTYFALQKLQIPMMPTFFMYGRALPITPPIPYPCIIKAATGRGGQEVLFIQNELDWLSFKKNAMYKDYVIQSTDVQLGKDLRVFIIGKEIIAAILRTNKHDFRANFNLGGAASLYELSKEEKKMIQRICSHFDFGLVGIDFLVAHDGKLIFNEIEDVVGSRILSEVTNINLLQKYVTFIIHTVQNKQFYGRNN